MRVRHVATLVGLAACGTNDMWGSGDASAPVGDFVVASRSVPCADQNAVPWEGPGTTGWVRMGAPVGSMFQVHLVETIEGGFETRRPAAWIIEDGTLWAACPGRRSELVLDALFPGGAGGASDN